MARQRYSIKESINRILRLFLGESTNEVPGTLSGEVLSEDAAWSDLAELFNDSLPGENLTLPAAWVSALVTSSNKILNYSGTYSDTPTAVVTNLFVAAGTSGTSVELPSPVTYSGYRYNVKKISGSGNVNVYPTNGGNIDGAAILIIETQYDNATLISDGGNWMIL